MKLIRSMLTIKRANEKSLDLERYKRKEMKGLKNSKRNSENLKWFMRI